MQYHFIQGRFVFIKMRYICGEELGGFTRSEQTLRRTASAAHCTTARRQGRQHEMQFMRVASVSYSLLSRERESVAVQASLGQKIRSGDMSEIVEEGGRIGLYWTIQCGIETVCSSRQAEIL